MISLVLFFRKPGVTLLESFFSSKSLSLAIRKDIEFFGIALSTLGASTSTPTFPWF
jgi:hypothetical protein